MPRILLLLIACLWNVTPLSAQYGQIDRHARRAPDSLSQNLPALARYLSAGAENETELARGIYTWVTRYLSYDQKASRQDERINESIRDIIQRRKGLCMDYALLYQALCRYAGLPCAKVDGYAAPRLTEGRRLPDKPDHAWNAVRADGQWRLVDATWSEVQDESHEAYGTTYFFTPPKIFILTHLPEQPMWQLLPCPISAQAFARPAQRIESELLRGDSCMAYPDSIAAFMALPPAEHLLASARASYATHPTPYTRRQWGAALFDRAALLDRRTEALPYPDSATAIIRLRATAIEDCERALALFQPEDWQRQLYAQLLLNHAIARYQLPARHPDAADGPMAIALLEKAKAQLLQLPETDYYRNYALPQCERLLEQLGD